MIKLARTSPPCPQWKPAIRAELTGLSVAAGDRPIEVTLQRTWQALTWRQKLQLGGMFLRAAFTRVHVDAQTVEALKTDESAAAFSAMLSSQFPKVSRHTGLPIPHCSVKLQHLSLALCPYWLCLGHVLTDTAV